MSLIARVEQFRVERASLLQDHPKVIGALSRAASSNIEGHLQRWIYELLQNAEDAKAEHCEIILRDGLLVIADDGEGFQPASVEALSTPFQSDKSGRSTIGRKGVGFSAAYDLTHAPLVISGKEGILFCRDRFSTWATENPIASTASIRLEDFPRLYTLVPFGLTEPECLDLIPALREIGLEGWTKVCLRLRDDRNAAPAIAGLTKMDFNFLLTFDHLKHLTVRDTEGVVFQVDLESDHRADGIGGADSFILRTSGRTRDARTVQYVRWTKKIQPGKELLKSHIDAPKAREAMATVTFRLAARLNEAGEVGEVEHGSESASRHFLVYYPTEDQSPMKALLHGDFLIESNRKHLLKPAACALNDSLFDELAGFVTETANQLSRSGHWKDAIMLLEPVKDAVEDEPGKSFWAKIRKAVADGLELPTSSGGFAPVKKLVVLPTGSARSVVMKLSGMKFPELSVASAELGEDQRIGKTLSALGVRVISDEDVIGWLTNPPKHLPPEAATEWVWNGWLYLADWLKKGGTTTKLEHLKLNPVGGTLESKGKRICWTSKESDQRADIPDWLPVRWLPEPLTNRLRRHQAPNLAQVLKGLGIHEFENRDLLEGLGTAIAEFWKLPESEHTAPEKFLRFLRDQPWLDDALEQNFYGTKVHGIPVEASQYGISCWLRASEVYFGEEWGDSDLATVYRNQDDVAWLLKGTAEDRRLFLCLGVNQAPRLLVVKSNSPWPPMFWERVVEKMLDCGTTNRQYPESRCDNPDELKKQLRVLENIVVQNLSTDQQEALLRLLYSRWETYETHASLKAVYPYYGQCHVEFDNVWWHEVKTHLKPRQNLGAFKEPLPLAECWLPGSPSWTGQLFSQIHLGTVGDSEDEIADWLTGKKIVRADVGDIPLSEWVRWLKLLPKVLADLDPSKHTKVVRQVYDGFLHCLRHKRAKSRHQGPETLNPSAIRETVCWKGELMLHLPFTKVWVVGMENDFSKWSAHLPLLLLDSKNVNDAVTFLKVNRIEDVLVEQSAHPLPAEEDHDIRNQIEPILPFLYSEDKRLRGGQIGREHFRSLKCYSADVIEIAMSLEVEGNPTITESREIFGEQSHRRFSVATTSKGSTMHLARGIREALGLGHDAGTLADLLLSTPIESIMRNRLLDRGIDSQDLEEDIEEYHARQRQTPPPEPPPATTQEAPILPPQTTVPPTNTTTPDSPTPTSVERPTRPLFPTVPAAPSRLTLRLPSDGSIHRIGRMNGATGGGGVGGGTSGTTQTEREKPPSQEQKDQIEAASIAWVRKALEAEGYERIEVMPPGNPGFDVKAFRDDDEYHLEVKGHWGQANSFEITQREMTEAENAGTGYRWMLWNVENLDPSRGDQVTLTPILRIGGQRAQSYSVRLNDCEQAPWPPEALSD